MSPDALGSSRVRINFAEELESAERSLMAEGRIVLEQLEHVVRALMERDVDLARRVIEADDRVDDIYLSTDARVFNLLALQSPVARDLRLVSAIIHSNLHLERMGDLCVNIAKFVLNKEPYPSDSPMLMRLREMGVVGSRMLELALAAFSQRSVELAERLPVEDDIVDRLNRGMVGDLKQHVSDDESFEWASKLLLVARYLERFGDHAVDIGEQVAFLVTGIFREFTDASHPGPLHRVVTPPP